MKYKLYRNTDDGMHCVQACLQMLCYYFNLEVPSISALDKILSHKPGMFTWLSKALLWLNELGFEIQNYENLDYKRFAKEGPAYLAKIWDKETYLIQAKYSNLKNEQKIAKQLLRSKVLLVNTRLSISDIIKKSDDGFLTMLSINPHALQKKSGYGSHLIILGKTKGRCIKIYDPDHSRPYYVTLKMLAYAFGEERKADFNAIFVRHEVYPRG